MRLDGKSLLVVGTGGVKRRAVFEALRDLGLGRIVCLNDAPNWAAPCVDEWIIADAVHPSGDGPLLVDEYLAARPGFAFDGVVTFDEYSVLLAAHLATRLGRIGVSPEVAERAKNKGAFRRFCREAGLPAPRGCVLPADALSDLRPVDQAGLIYPLVVKPAHGAGSVFVEKVSDRIALLAAVARFERAVVTSDVARLWPDTSLLVEEYLDGPEVDIDLLLQGGTARYAMVSDNLPPTEPYFLEVGGQIPSTLPAAVTRALIDCACTVLRALGVTDGCVHFEARSTARGPVPIEANLRLGGAEIYAFHRAAFGVDLVEGAVRIAVGLPVAKVERAAPLRHLASINFLPARAGRIRAIHIDPTVRASPDLVELVIFRSAGETIRLPPDGYDYYGWMVTAGDDSAAARAHLAVLAAGVHCEIEEEPG